MTPSRRWFRELHDRRRVMVMIVFNQDPAGQYQATCIDLKYR
jgi:hypothetical protein